MNWEDKLARQAVAEAMEADSIMRLKNATKLLPAWFVERMMEDEGHFAFLMVSGDVVHFSRIDAVHLSADGIWLDVDLIFDEDFTPPVLAALRHITAPTERTRASINARHIMMAFETAELVDSLRD